MVLNINLGKPYEVFIESMIKKGYAGSQVEVIRQAISLYKRQMEDEGKFPAEEASNDTKPKAGKQKKIPLEDVKEKFGLR